VNEMKKLDVPIERDWFFRRMIRTFAKSLEETVGVSEASGYVALVGSEMGQWIESEYQKSADEDCFGREEVAEMLVDLKRRIGGDFHIVSVDENRIVLGNRKCPFDELAIGRPSLCQMTSNVFGRITANQLGYARIELEETIAKGHDGCHIVIHLKPDGDTTPEDQHEFYPQEESCASE